MKKAFERVVAISLVFLLNILYVTPIYALSSTRFDEFSQNNILFYDPDETGGGTGTVCSNGLAYSNGEITVSGSTMEEIIWTGLTSFMTPEQAAGVMGNMVSESNFNPAQHEVSLLGSGIDIGTNTKDSYGLGLIQWSYGRRVNMYNYVKSQNASLVQYLEDWQTYSPTYTSGETFLELAGRDVASELALLELQFLRDELVNNPSYSGIFDTKTVEEAAYFFLTRVEIPADMESKAAGRTENALRFYEKYSGLVGSDGITCVGGSSDQPVGSVYESSADVPCDSRTIDKGTADGYSNGTKITIRLCALPNTRDTDGSPLDNQYIVVNSRVSGAFYAFNEAHKARYGNYLTASEGFRTMGEQQYFYNCYVSGSCNGGNLAASPGYSNHQMGLAVDFNTGGFYNGNTGLCTWIGGSCYLNSDFLSEFGLKDGRNFGSPENWHVEAKGS